MSPALERRLIATPRDSERGIVPGVSSTLEVAECELRNGRALSGPLKRQAINKARRLARRFNHVTAAGPRNCEGWRLPRRLHFVTPALHRRNNHRHLPRLVDNVSAAGAWRSEAWRLPGRLPHVSAIWRPHDGRRRFSGRLNCILRDRIVGPPLRCSRVICPLPYPVTANRGSSVSDFNRARSALSRTP